MILNRRSLLAGSAAVGFAGLSGGFARAASMKGRLLRVATYGGSWRDGVAEHIAKPLSEAGAQVEFVLGNPDDNLAKLIAAKRQGQIPFDVLDGSPLTYPDAYKAGLFDKINFSEIPGVDNVPSWARDEGQVSVLWAPDGIVYNEEAFKAAGVPPPEKVSDLKNPKLKGRVAFPAPSLVHHWSAVIDLARESGGGEANLVPAIKHVKEIEPAYYFSSSVDVSTRFGSKDIWAAPWGAGWAVRMKRSGLPIAVSYQSFGKQKGTMWPGARSIAKGTPNMEAALAYLGQWLTVEGPAAFSIATGVVPINPKARAIMIEKEPGLKALLPLTDEDIENTYKIDWAKLDSKAWRATWNRELQRQ